VSVERAIMYTIDKEKINECSANRQDVYLNDSETKRGRKFKFSKAGFFTN